MMTHNICAVIPIKNLKDAEENVKKALKCNPNFIEYRFDYIQDVKDIDFDMLVHLKDLVPNNVPLIFTFRDYKEGGKRELDLNQKINIVTELFHTKPDYIDIEMNSEDNLLRKVNELAIHHKVNLIFSNHNFKDTKSLENSIELIELFEKRLGRLDFSKEIIKKSVLKIIHTATKFSDNFVPLDLCEYYKKKSKKIISFCMGNLGIFSRIFCLKAGAFLTYGSLEEITAPGQIKIEEIRKMIENFM